MGEVTGLTAAKMQEIADASVVSGEVNGSGHLILTTSGGSTVDAGDVTGPTGATGATGPAGAAGASATGTVTMWAASTPPTGWLLCNGAAVSRTTYSTLYALIGTTYGTGDGSTTFNIPNMQQKYARQDTGALGVTGGSDTHSHQIDGGSVPAVAHISLFTATVGLLQKRLTGGASYTGNMQAGFGGEPSSSTESTNAGTEVVGQTQTASSDPPYLNLNFIIKY